MGGGSKPITSIREPKPKCATSKLTLRVTDIIREKRTCITVATRVETQRYGRLWVEPVSECNPRGRVRRAAK